MRLPQHPSRETTDTPCQQVYGGAYVADGEGGLKVVQLFSPATQPNFYGFSPDPKPELIASYPTRNAALSVTRPLERDRAVDETGHQVAILGRIGSRPFTLEEMQRLYLNEDGKPWFVTDEVEGRRGIETEYVPYRPNRIIDMQPDAPRVGPYGWREEGGSPDQ